MPSKSMAEKNNIAESEAAAKHTDSRISRLLRFSYRYMEGHPEVFNISEERCSRAQTGKLAVSASCIDCKV